MDEKLAKNLDNIINAPTYRLAHEDHEFLMNQELRPVRMQLELLKCEMGMSEAEVESTIVVFGGTAIVEESVARERLEKAEAELKADPDDAKKMRTVSRARRILAKSGFYEDARRFSKLVSQTCQVDGSCEYVIITGGGPGIMEAANRGAFEVGAKSAGLNITLPSEQHPNPYITPELCFQFKYFALRKMHFLLRAKALVVFPGGFGTLDELFCTLTLRQTGRMQALPIILYGEEYWRKGMNLEYFADEGVIADHHLELFQYSNTPEETWQIIQDYYEESKE